MLRSAVIAKCLLRIKAVPDLEEGEAEVRRIFNAEHPGLSFDEWNRELDEAVAQALLLTLSRAPQINIKRFIAELW
jgi:hypothetical protein